MSSFVTKDKWEASVKAADVFEAAAQDIDYEADELACTLSKWRPSWLEQHQGRQFFDVQL